MLIKDRDNQTIKKEGKTPLRKANPLFIWRSAELLFYETNFPDDIDLRAKAL